MRNKAIIRFGIGEKIYWFEIKAKKKGWVKGFPNGEDDLPHNKFIITVTNLKEKKKASFYFYDSFANFQKGKDSLNDIELVYAFRCFLEDGLNFVDYDIDEFFKEFGFEKVSTCLKAYDECKRAFKKLIRLGLDEEEIRNIVNFLIKLENEDQLESVLVV